MIIDMLYEISEDKNAWTKLERLDYIKEWDYKELNDAIAAKDEAKIKRLLCIASLADFNELCEIIKQRIFKNEITLESGNVAIVNNFANHLKQCDAVNSLEWI